MKTPTKTHGTRRAAPGLLLLSTILFSALPPFSLSAFSDTATAPDTATVTRTAETAGEPAAHPDADPARPVPDQANRKTKTGNEWVVAPIPSYNPSQEVGLTVVAQYIFHPKGQAPATPPSVLALSAFYTQQDSWGGFAAYLGHLKDDQWRTAFGGGYMNYNYDYYGDGDAEAEKDIAYPVNQRMTMMFGRLTYRVYSHLYAGLAVLAADTRYSTTATLPSGYASSGSVRSYTVGPVLQWDTRDNQFFPGKGSLANMRLEYVGGDNSYGKFEIDWNKYLSFDALPGSVLALRAVARYVGEEAPFFALSQFGSHNDLRGYKSGKYRDNALIATQAEWRQKITAHWYAAVFAGIGEVEPRITDLSASDVLASAGLGIRYRLGKKNPVNLRLDWAYGKDGGAWYFSVGEAF